MHLLIVGDDGSLDVQPCCITRCHELCAWKYHPRSGLDVHIGTYGEEFHLWHSNSATATSSCS
ncbi:hypothetical protein K443DRAFT_613304 [Laccaria amethystina LaAM-08-1]|uniref:Unplaced genomic scaffold K443scaffold_94, whole genome shotgun sequence n=1 Tax=Laccaria amethystina LaAM-08-1 TaxID=1095629 RepID=A0A0C9X5F4_9AGAR|nr:hypothetical protein K443DRAFT_613304 [Laccaria amethystina LaAM-08-1]